MLTPLAGCGIKPVPIAAEIRGFDDISAYNIAALKRTVFDNHAERGVWLSSCAAESG